VADTLLHHLTLLHIEVVLMHIQCVSPYLNEEIVKKQAARRDFFRAFVHKQRRGRALPAPQTAQQRRRASCRSAGAAAARTLQLRAVWGGGLGMHVGVALASRKCQPHWRGRGRCVPLRPPSVPFCSRP
jgi:hypothetical protein